MSDDDRANRLRQRRNKAKRRTGKEESKLSEPSEPEEQAEQSEPSEQAEQSETDEQSVKDEHEGVYVYLPPEQKEELGHVFNAAKATYEREHGGEFEKNRHYYPLIVEYGLEQVDDAGADELVEMLEELDY